MKINTKALREALSACAPIAKLRTALPILQCVRLEASNNTLNIQATNCDVYIERVVECEGELDVCAVKLALIQQAVENIAADQFGLELDGKLVLTEGKSVTRFNVQDAKGFPAWPKSSATKTAVNSIDLADGLNAVVWACAEESEKLDKMENVCVSLSENAVECMASSIKAFAHYKRASIAAKCGFRIPANFTPSLIYALRQPHSLLSVSESFADCSYDGGRTMCKLSELEFVMGWERIMDARIGRSFAMLNTKEVMQLCALCMSYHSDQRYPQIDLKWNDELVDVEINGDVATRKQQIAAKGKGSGEAYSNAKYLARALVKMGDEVKFTPSESASFWESGDLCVAVMQLRAKAL